MCFMFFLVFEALNMEKMMLVVFCWMENLGSFAGLVVLESV